MFPSIGVMFLLSCQMFPQASQVQRPPEHGQTTTSAKLLSPKFVQRTAKSKVQQQETKPAKHADSPPSRKLIRQNTDVSESDTSESFATPPSSPVKETTLSPAQKSPATWNSNPLYKSTKNDSAGSSPIRSPSRSQSDRSTLSSLATDSSPLGSPVNKGSLSRTSKSWSVDSSSGTPGHFIFPKSSTTLVSDPSASPERSIVIDNKSSIFSQQTRKCGTEPPSPPTRKDSITKARKNSRKLDTENMLYGEKDIVCEEENIGCPSQDSKPEDISADSVQKQADASQKNCDKVNHASSNGKVVEIDKVSFNKTDRITVNADIDQKSNYLDGFLMDAPDNTLIKPSKLRESMRKNRARRAQTAPVERGDVDKALEEIDRRWAKPERSTALSHLPLADRLAFRKMRTEREQNNNEINKLLKKEMFSNAGDKKVLTTGATSTVTCDDCMNTPITISPNSSAFDSPAITPVLKLSTGTTAETSISQNAPFSSRSIHTVSEPLPPKDPPPNSQISSDNNKDMSSMKGSMKNESLLNAKRWNKDRSSSLDDHVSIYSHLCFDYTCRRLQ